MYLESVSHKSIVIFGGGSGSGKTSLAETIIKGRRMGWAAIKITPSYLYSGMAIENGASSPEKDTRRLSAAGADPVIHIRAQTIDLEECLEQAVGLVPPDRFLLIEGRGALSFIKPALSIFVWRPELKNAKENLDILMENADLVLVNAGEKQPEEEKIHALFKGKVIRHCLIPEEDRLRIRDLEKILKQKGLA